MMRGAWRWILLLGFAAACATVTFRHFDLLLPILDVDVKMTRDVAIARAAELNERLRLSPARLTRSAAGFRGDPKAQTFIEQEGGGKGALKPLLGEGEHVLYTWRARLFEPGVTHEVSVLFTPAGRPYGFRARVPEAEAGAALEQDAARALAMERARADWGVDFARYKPVAASTQKRTGGRVDHEFRFERIDSPIGEGKLLLGLAVSGDRLTGLVRGVQVPEAFDRRYAERRSANSTISAGANVVMMLAYMLGGCLFGAIWLARRGAWNWKPAAAWALAISLLGAAAVLESIPSSWLTYDTAVPPETHYAKGIGAAAAALLSWWAVLMATFAAGEGLGRLAFGHHPQLWRAWSPRTGATRAIVGRTLGGYAWVGIELAFVALFYYVTHTRFGWWSPGELLVDPNILGHAQPWLSPVANALRAGVWEEFLFRAVPLAGAALIGRHFGREKLFIGVALVLQAIVFGCAHADYPQEPSWARPVELFLPSIVWGLVYLRYGILPGILMHFGFDLALMSTPLWVTDAPGIAFDRAMVVLFGAAPLLIVLWRVARSRGMGELAAIDLNALAPRFAPLWRPGSAADVPLAAQTLTRRATLALAVLGAIGAVGWVIRLATPADAPGLRITRSEAVRIAEDAIRREGFTPGPEWRRLAKAEGPRDREPHAFVWQQGGEEAFKALLGTHLAPPLWAVRFARFAGEVDVADRAEAWFVFVGGDGEVRAVHHRLPEARPGARLTNEEARNKAHAELVRWLGVDPARLRFVSGRAIDRPQRLDWEFIYADPSRQVPAGGEAYVQVDIAGDQVAARGRYVFVPEAWSRERKAKKDASQVITGVAGLALIFLLGSAVVLAIRRFARHEAAVRAALAMGAIAALYVCAQKLLGLEASMTEAYDTAQPLAQQYTRDALVTLGMAASAGLFAALFGGVGVRAASGVPAPGFAAWRDAGLLAFLMLGGGTIARLVVPVAREPRMPNVRDAEAWSPIVSGALDGVDFLVLCASAATFLAVLGSRSGWRAWVTGAVFVLGALVLGARSPDFTPLTLAGTMAVGLLAFHLYRRFVLGRVELAAPLVAWLAALSAVQHLVARAHAQAVGAALASLASIALGYALWAWLVRRDRTAAKRAMAS